MSTAVALRALQVIQDVEVRLDDEVAVSRHPGGRDEVEDHGRFSDHKVLQEEVLPLVLQLVGSEGRRAISVNVSKTS